MVKTSKHGSKLRAGKIVGLVVVGAMLGACASQGSSLGSASVNGSQGSPTAESDAQRAEGAAATLASAGVGTTDSDGDGLSDSAESNGYSVNTAGIVSAGKLSGQTFVNLPAMGADPLHKDLFIHLDYMDESWRLDNNSGLRWVRQAFANSPLTNPDGRAGISIHIDQGPDSVMNARTGAKWGSLSRAGLIPLDLESDIDTEMPGYRAQTPAGRPAGYSGSRRGYAFRYGCICRSFPFEEPGDENTVGIGNLPGSNFLVLWGAQPGGGPQLLRASTLMHELGHTLNLWHGGAPGAENYKPNYYSIMNYSYDYLPRLSDGKAILDYSRSTRSVDERSLNEVTSLPNPPYGLIGKDDGGLVRIPIIGNSVDWNLNGSVDSASFAQDLNGDGSLSFLGGNTDWIVGVVPGTIMFKAGSIGQTSNAALRAPQRNEVDVEAPTAPDSTRFFFEDWDPVASFEASKVIGLGPLSVAFDASTSTDPDGLTSDLTYEWNFGDGSPAGEGVNPTHVFTTPGIYQVELGVTDADGFENEAVATQNIEVKASNKPPVATFSADPTSSNPPSNVTFDATASTDFDGSLVNYAWDYGDGTTGSGVSGMHNYTTVGVRTVKLTVTDDNGATASTTQRVRIGVPNTPPVAAFASTLASGPTPLAVAVDGSTSTDSDGSIAAYEWDFGDGSAVVAGSSASHVFGTAGTFTIRLKVTDNEGATSEAARVVTATAAKAATAPAPTATSTPAVAVLGTSILAPLRFVGATARRASRGTSFRITLSGASASKQLVVVRRLAKVRTKSKGKWRTISVWKRVGSSYTNTGGAASFTIRTKLATGSTVRIDVAGQQRRLKVAKQVVVKKKASKARASRR